MLKFKPGDLVKITGSVTIDRKNMAGSVALIVGLAILLFSLALIRKSLVSSNVTANPTTK